jgi:hypothetical protein
VADEAVLNTVHRKKSKKYPCFFIFKGFSNKRGLTVARIKKYGERGK